MSYEQRDEEMWKFRDHRRKEMKRPWVRGRRKA